MRYGSDEEQHSKGEDLNAKKLTPKGEPQRGPRVTVVATIRSDPEGLRHMAPETFRETQSLRVFGFGADGTARFTLLTSGAIITIVAECAVSGRVQILFDHELYITFKQNLMLHVKRERDIVGNTINRFLKLTKRVYDLMQITKFYTAFAIYTNDAAAVNSFRSGNCISVEAGYCIAMLADRSHPL